MAREANIQMPLDGAEKPFEETVGRCGLWQGQ